MPNVHDDRTFASGNAAGKRSASIVRLGRGYRNTRQSLMTIFDGYSVSRVAVRLVAS
jgi:hypothetical protein